MDFGGCVFTALDTLKAYQPVSISALGTTTSCSMGASGSASVIGAGSATGYNYEWSNSTNSVVSTSSVAANLPTGNYTITLSAAGSQSAVCGTATAAVVINTAVPGIINILKPYCNNSNYAYLSMPGGSNYQWYSNITSIGGATTSAYTVSSPCNGCIYRVRYTSPQGCLDSIKFTLIPIPGGSLSIVFNTVICQGASTGLATFSITGPTLNTPTFSIFSVGNTPSYSAVGSPTGTSAYSANNLSGGANYSVSAFDGSCLYTSTFTVPAIVFDFTTTPANSPTICPGNVAMVSVSFSNNPLPGQYTYSWSPSTFLFGTNAQMTPFIPTVTPGSVTTMVYTVVVTPTIANCPLSKTLQISAANPITPTINPVPSLCGNAPGFTLTANPPGGVFSGNNAISGGGILTPSLAVTGGNVVMYTSSLGNCSALAATVFTIDPVPLISVTGNNPVCDGTTVTLQAMGVDTFTWNGIQSGATFSFIPASNTVYTVSGTNTVTSCSNSMTLTVLVLSRPTLAVIGDTAICAGESTTLTGAGASNYMWLSGTSILGQGSIVITPGVQSTYTLYGTDTNGCSSSKTVTISVSGCTGLIENTTGKEMIHLFPNPFSGKFTLETQNNLKIHLSDMTGRTILEQNFEKGLYTIDLEDFADGLYILRANNGNETRTVKLVKEN
jgi:hypothetical protein